MGCCHSSSSKADQQQEAHQNQVEAVSAVAVDPPLTKFSFSDIKTATRDFCPENIVSETGDEKSDLVYMGRLENDSFIAVKQFNNMAWPDPDEFVEQAEKVGKIRHKRIVNLIGYCCDGDKRLLVAEYMPTDSLAKRLFHWENQTLEWRRRLNVAYCISEALAYCGSSGFDSYNSLSAYSVLFNERGEACLSCFGFMKEINGDPKTNGSVNPKNVIYRFGTVLVNLLTGKQIPPSHAPESIHGREVIELMDPKLKGYYSLEEAITVFKLAFECLQYEDKESSLSTREIVARLEPLQTKIEVPFHEMVEMTRRKQVYGTRVSPLEEACSSKDLAAIHGILIKTEYEDDKEVLEFSFEEWTQDIKDLQEVRIRGDQAFIEKDFKTAIECYSQYIEGRGRVYPSVYARRSLCYLFCKLPEKALYDGMRAQQMFPDWPTAFYLQSVALSELNMDTDSANTLKEATLLEAKRQED